MPKHTKNRVIILLAALSLIWIFSIDRSLFVDSCEDCFWSRDVVQYRFATIPFYTRYIEYNSSISYVSHELGDICKHENVKRYYKQRWWGMIFCYCPCTGSIDRLNCDDELYNEGVRGRIKLLLISNPHFPEEFKKHVLREHDMEYWKKIRKELFLY